MVSSLTVVERICHKKGHVQREVLHLAETNAASRITICGWTFDGLTMIPLSSWGNPDREWCRRCERIMRSIESSGRSGVAGGTETPEE